MKKIAFIFLMIILVIFLRFKKNAPPPVTIPTPSSVGVPTTHITKQKELPKKSSYSTFVPYWSEGNASPAPQIDISIPYTQQALIYFGITADEHGIDTSEPGYGGLASFIKKTKNNTMQKVLTLRLINDSVTETILKKPDVQDTIIRDAVSIAKKNGFNELLLDLEIHVISTEKTVSDITALVQKLSAEAQANSIRFSIALYGDVFYRKRPYDVASIAKATDMIYIMAYDFHKSYGEPGPNFPLSGKNIYGYDVKTMIDEYLRLVPAEKLTVVFGMYGYDWTVDSENRPLKSAKALTLTAIKKNLINSCNYSHCSTASDPISTESKSTYSDSDGHTHIVWFEREQSVKQKIQYLLSKQISSFAFWAYGYY